MYDSHSFDWATQLLRDTNGEGVDAVLNSLNGAHILLIFSALSVFKHSVTAKLTLGCRLLHFTTVFFQNLEKIWEYLQCYKHIEVGLPGRGWFCEIFTLPNFSFYFLQVFFIFLIFCVILL